jgi:ATP-dependent DNA ligase
MAAPEASPRRAVTDAPHRTGIVPMMAALSALPADEDCYAFEVKWDGMRAIAHCEPGGLWLQTRTLRDITGGFPELAGLQNELGARNAVVDGEIVAFDADGRPASSACRRACISPIVRRWRSRRNALRLCT